MNKASFGTNKISGKAIAMEQTEKNLPNRNTENRIIFCYAQDHKVVESNFLIKSLSNMDAVPLKVYVMSVAQLDVTHPPKDRTVLLKKQDIFDFLGGSTSSSKHTRLKNTLKKLIQQAVFTVDTKGKGNERDTKIIAPIEQAQFNWYSEFVAITFSSSIMPYLLVKEGFTQYPLSDIYRLRSKYSIFLYRYFKMRFSQWQASKSDPAWSKENLDKLKNPEFSIDSLRSMLGCAKKYKDMRDFEKRVLKIAIAEINQYTPFSVTYEKLEGHKIIKFGLNCSEPVKVPYKEIQKDPAFLASKESKRDEQETLYLQAVNSKYTKLLTKHFLIGTYDILDIKIMSGLQKKVYPLYDKLKDQRGLNGVDAHLSYVTSHKEGYVDKNTVKYLEVAVKGYLQRLL